MTIYATTAELRARLGLEDGAPDPTAGAATATTLLRIASGLVDAAIESGRYAIDSDGFPTRSDQLEAVREAVLDMAEAWVLNAIDPRLGTSQVAREVESKSLSNGGASVKYGSRPAALTLLAAGESLTDAAYGRLERAGLTSPAVSIGGASDVYTLKTPIDLTTGQALEP